MPELKLGLNDKAFFESQGKTTRSHTLEFDDMKFHTCVRLSKFENERIISSMLQDLKKKNEKQKQQQDAHGIGPG